METFDYLVGLFSIVIGLGLAEVAVSLNRLLRSAGLRHDPLIFGPPILVTLMLVSIWFDTWAIRGVHNLFSFPFFVAIFGQLLLLYLLAAACVPKAAMAAAWPTFVVRGLNRELQEARWIGEVRPQFARFTLDVHYRLGDAPHVRVLRPALVRPPDNVEGQLPHVYPPADDPTLCLFDPALDQWDSSMTIAETTVPWAMDWIACYELWLMTGRWTGGGRHGSAIPQMSEGA